MNRAFYIKRNGLFVPPVCRMNPAFLGSTVNRPVSGGGGGSNTSFVTSVTGGTVTSPADFTGRVGFKFQPASDITITDLGLFVNTGDTGSFTVFLSNESGSSVLGSASVDTTGQSAGAQVFASITPVTLDHTLVYQVQRVVTNGQGTYRQDNGTITTTADGTISFSTYYDGSEHVNTAGVKAYGVPNFKYHL